MDPFNTYNRQNIEGYVSLEELALDLIWSWKHRADKIWSRLDPDLWEITHNPWVVLQTVSREKLETLLKEPDFRKSLDEILKDYRNEVNKSTWFQQNHQQSPLSCIAYFSMEFMLSEALPIYSGGLGNVAGDQLKSASDLGVPVVAVGLLYQQGYFRQIIDKDGMQEALYPYNNPGQLPIMPLRKANGEWLRVKVSLPGWPLWLRAWQVNVGRVKLYLLDSNDAANYPVHRAITSELYGGGSEIRLKQELVLGIGGWRLLEELGIKPEVCHLNEGHAAFAILERAKSFMKEHNQPFDVALAATRAGNLFTTHTAVPAGFDRFSPFMIEQYLGRYAQENLKLSVQDLLALGRANPKDSAEEFNMAYLAIRGSGAVNGVSRLHGKVSRRIFEPIFQRWPEDDVPVGYVTNGVHMPSWDSAMADKVWTEACGKDRWLGPTNKLEKEIKGIPDATLWKLRNESRKALIEHSRSWLARQLAARGASAEEVELAQHFFDPNTLTLGFARRFATYKRPNMLLHDQERLLKILNNPQRPVQLVIAGKAHPHDKPGQAMITEWMRFIKRPEVRSRVIFLSDYNMLLTESLVQGVDVWLNTPRRPWEACGTSGMKVLVNGGINLSELDGWWAEAYVPEVGWAIGDGQEHENDPSWDAIEAASLYDILEHEIVPEFYTRDEEGIPRAWTARMRESMSKLTPQFSANRSVREYTEKYYIPNAAAFRERSADGVNLGKQIVDWKHALQLNWHSLRFGEVKIETNGDQHTFEVQVYLNDLYPDAVKVELFIDAYNGSSSKKYELPRIKQIGASTTYVYKGSVPSSAPAQYYTPRLVPYFKNVSTPLEVQQILWQR